MGAGSQGSASVAGGMLPVGAASALVVAEFTPTALAIMLEETAFSWHETLGVSPRADASTARKAMTKLALI